MVLASAVLGGAAGCSFDPLIPNGRVLCVRNVECPTGFTCEPIEDSALQLRVCCRQRGCARLLTQEEKTNLEAAARMNPAVVGRDSDGGAGSSGGAQCGNGTVEQGETCDPPGSCPTSCPQMGCETFELVGRAATCTAQCLPRGKQTMCTTGDRCCPPGCATAGDKDCSCTCGNGVVEEACGEKCDPLSACPTTCAPRGCMLRRPTDPGTCMSECSDDRLQTSCVNGDGCCPATCNAGNDSDCQPTCGNRVVEQGETCDPAESCPSACPPVGCTKQRLQGTAAGCTARCVDDGMQTACASGDGCCPAGCTSAMDTDCLCTCGNGQVETSCGETCDPLSSCPTACPPRACQLRRLVNGNGCGAQCLNDGLQTMCTAGDGCCPPTCHAGNDSDCQPRCGNGVVETGEVCDPPSSCPTTCPWNGCGRRKLEGMAMACTARCADDGTMTMCAPGDGCCPPSCNSGNDTDCMARCGNGVVEAGEKCDGASCPTSCAPMGCQTRRLSGSAQQCSAECVNDAVISACMTGDGCCPSGCTTVNDGDCTCRCGNGTTEAACNEKCDGSNCPTSCPPMGCQRRTLQGSASACTAECVNGAQQTACANSDGCCPSSCNANNDNDCQPTCGNRTVEAGEKCDPVSACQTQHDACVNDPAAIRTRTGSVSACTFECQSMPRPCSAMPDGFCPASCTPCAATCGASQDIDCKLANGAVCTHRNQCQVGCLDGRCCAVASCAACESCTGANGTCADIAAGGEDNEPAGTCTGANSCNGMGACRKDNGQTCGTDGAQCASGRCVDGVCCAAACTAACQSCAVAGMLGQCRPLPDGATDPNSTPACMNGGKVCSAGACKIADRFACNTAADCVSNACTTFYQDNDGDGHATATGPKLCGTSPPPGFHVLPGADCCDGDPRVNPAQTAFFPTTGNCGGFDYNCSGVAEQSRRSIQDCGPANCTSGWVNAVPACGASGTFMDCRRTGPGGGFCDNTTAMVVQSCR